MKLSDVQIKEYIKNPQNTKISEFVDSHNKLNMFSTGQGIDEYIVKIQGLETGAKIRLRKKFARSTKDVVNKILRPTDKVYSAKGGSFQIEIKNKNQKEEFLESMNNIAEGMSKRIWLENYALDAYHIDPNGIIFVEIPKIGSISMMPYPTFKSIKSIHDYIINGQDIDYVIFNAEIIEIDNETRRVFRVVDDEKDALYYLDNNDDLKIHTAPGVISYIYNNLGSVPAFVVSNLIDKNNGGKKSMLEPITELLAEYLQDTSIKSIYKFLHGYPFFWRFVADCKACQGQGFTTTDDGSTVKCNVCDGTGKNFKKDVSDTFDLTIPLDRDDAILDVAKTPAGYVEPSVASWKQMTEEQIFMVDIMVRSYWGTSLDDRYDRETAQGRIIDTQPVADKLNKYADWAEVVDKKLTDIIGKIKYRTNYEKSYIFYGRRFLIESSDQIWRKYVEARSKFAPDSALTQILIQYYHSEFQNDTVMLTRALKLLEIEPYPHLDFTILGSVASNSQKQRKLAFSEWSRSKFDVNKETEILRDEFEKFAEEKEEQVENPNINLKQNPDESKTA